MTNESQFHHNALESFAILDWVTRKKFALSDVYMLLCVMNDLECPVYGRCLMVYFMPSILHGIAHQLRPTVFDLHPFVILVTPVRTIAMAIFTPYSFS